MELTHIGDYKIKLQSIDSTNNYAASLFGLGKPAEGTVVVSEFQEKGRGQHQAPWESEKGKNLLASFIFYPRIDLSDFFCLNQCISLAVREAVARFLPDRRVLIKWPNDILVDQKKIAGILMENSIRGSQFIYSISGIGINVNQAEFENYSPPATSLINETGQATDLTTVLQALCDSLNAWYERLRRDELSFIRTAYPEVLYGRGEQLKFSSPSGDFKAVPEGVREDGKLALRLADGSVRYAGFREIGFVF